MHVGQTRLCEVLQVPHGDAAVARERGVLTAKRVRRRLVQRGEVPDVEFVDGHIRRLEDLAAARWLGLFKRIPTGRFELWRVNVADVRALAVGGERPRVRIRDVARDHAAEPAVGSAAAPWMVRLDLVLVILPHPLAAAARAPHAVVGALRHLHPMRVTAARAAVEQERHASRVRRPQRDVRSGVVGVNDTSQFTRVAAVSVVESSVRLHRSRVPQPPGFIVRRHRQLALQHPPDVNPGSVRDLHHRVPGVPVRVKQYTTSFELPCIPELSKINSPDVRVLIPGFGDCR